MTPTDTHRHQCIVCNRAYVSAAALGRHIRTHRAVRPFCCPVCGDRFTEKGGLVRHTKARHTADRPYVCTVCDRDFAIHYDFVVHTRTHVKRPYTCRHPGCGRKFTDAPALDTHAELHAANKGFSCNTCGRWYSNRARLVDHHMTHMDIKPYKCSVCSKYLATAYSLRGHMRIHTGAKPFTCTHCFACFRLRPTLTRHVKTMHPDHA